MAFVLFDNGVRCTWDENLSVGTLIRTYNEGYHVLERIDFRDNPRKPDRILGISGAEVVEFSHPDMQYTPLFHYVKVLKDDGSPSKALRNTCDASFCFAVTRDSAAQEEQLELTKIAQKYEAIRRFI